MATDLEFDLEEERSWPPPSDQRQAPPVWQSVHGAYHAIRIRIQKDVADLCLDASEALVLSYVWSSPGCSPGEIRRALGFHRSTLSSLLGRLEAKGLVKRGIPGFESRRLMVNLTARGDSIATTARAVLVDLENELGGWTSPADRRGAGEVFAACLAMVGPEEIDAS
jgi:DNA-binding MarR family transcriptional regulator